MVIEDIYNDNRIPRSAYIPTFVRSLVMVPVRLEDPVAAIGAYWAEPRRATEQEVETLQRIANSAAVAMTNVILIKSLAAAKEETQRAKDAIVMAMASLAATRDKETGNHLYRTQHYVRALAQGCQRRGLYASELDESAIELLFRAAPLHDVGKVGIPDGILLKPGKLEPAEFEIMKNHASIGAEAIGKAMHHIGSASPFLQLAQEIALSHHEK